MTQLRKPPRLARGMTVGVCAPSGPVFNRSDVDRAVAAIERLGFRVVLAPHARDGYGYLAGSDADRAADLHEMLERPDVDAIICLRGGYGAIRTAAALDLPRLRRLADAPPKPFVGYSDITVLHALLQRELGWVTFYGPMGTTFVRGTAYTRDQFGYALIEAEPFDIAPDPDDPFVATLVPGRVEAPLAGGCLSLVASLVGTPWEIDLRDTIFFFEDVNEPPYSIDRMLMQLLQAGKLQSCAGIVVGEHAGCEPRGGNSLSLEQVFADLLVPLGVPLIYGLPIGHGRHHATLPLGVRAALDAGAGTLRILEPGVT